MLVVGVRWVNEMQECICFSQLLQWGNVDCLSILIF